MGFPPRSACLQISGQTHIKCDGFIAFIWQRSWMCVWTEIILWSCSPMKVLEMYSDTWLPERLISDRWDSSLFSILLNCSTKQRYRTAMYCLSALWWYHGRIFYGLNNDFTVANEKRCLLNKLWWKTTQIYDICWWSENPGNPVIWYFHIIHDEVILSCLYVG